jgi:hypothetical protein
MIALKGKRTGELLSFRGYVLLHDGPMAEAEYLIVGPTPIELPGTAEQISARLGRPVMMLRDHPGFASVQWPIRKGDFRD